MRLVLVDLRHVVFHPQPVTWHPVKIFGGFCKGFSDPDPIWIIEDPEFEDGYFLQNGGIKGDQPWDTHLRALKKLFQNLKKICVQIDGTWPDFWLHGSGGKIIDLLWIFRGLDSKTPNETTCRFHATPLDWWVLCDTKKPIHQHVNSNSNNNNNGQPCRLYKIQPKIHQF